MLKLKLQYFGHLMRRTDSLKKSLMLGKIEGKRRRGQQRMRWLDSITNSKNVLLLLLLSHFSRVRPFAGPMDCSLPGSSAHGIFQARVLEWGAIAFSKKCKSKLQ